MIRHKATLLVDCADKDPADVTFIHYQCRLIMGCPFGHNPSVPRSTGLFYKCYHCSTLGKMAHSSKRLLCVLHMRDISVVGPSIYWLDQQYTAETAGIHEGPISCWMDNMQDDDPVLPEWLEQAREEKGKNETEFRKASDSSRRLI